MRYSCPSVGFVHTNDRIALLEIARQLDVEEELGEHISVLNEKYCMFLQWNIFPQLSFAAALNYLLDGLRSGSYKYVISCWIGLWYGVWFNIKSWKHESQRLGSSSIAFVTFQSIPTELLLKTIVSFVNLLSKLIMAPIRSLFSCVVARPQAGSVYSKAQCTTAISCCYI